MWRTGFPVWSLLFQTNYDAQSLVPRGASLDVSSSAVKPVQVSWSRDTSGPAPAGAVMHACVIEVIQTIIIWHNAYDVEPVFIKPGLSCHH